MAETRERIIEMFHEGVRLPWRPERKPLKEGTIIDENQTVVWNREQVKKSQEEYELECKKLNKERTLAYDKVVNAAYAYIQENLATCYPIDKCIILYNVAYSKAHDAGFEAVMDKIDELIEFVDMMDT